MTTKHAVIVVAVLAAIGVLAAAGYAIEGQKATSKPADVPQAVSAAVEKAFAGAETQKVKKEREGVLLYEVKLTKGGAEIEAEIAPDGTIVKTEMAVAKNELPAPVAAALAKLAEGAEIKELVRTETHAEVKLVTLEKPVTAYEADVVKDGKTTEVKIDAAGQVVSQEIQDGKEEKDEKCENEQKVSMDKLPAPVKDAIQKAAGSNPIKEIEAKTEGGKSFYEAEWIADGKKVEIKVAADGKVLESQTGEDKED